MGLSDRLVRTITRRSRTVIAALLVLSLVVGSGVTAVEQSSSFDQFETDSEEAEKLEYVEENFGTDDNETTAQIIVRDGDALSKSSLISTLELQQEFREDETIEPTLAEEPFADLSNVVATTAIIDERQSELEDRADELEERGEELEERGNELQERGENLEAEQEELEEDAAELEEDREALEEDAAELEAEGEELEERRAALEEEQEALEEDAAELEAEGEELEERQAALEEDREALEARGEFMTETLDETRELRTAYDQGEITALEYAAGIESLRADAEEELPADEFEAFSPLIDDVAGTQAELNELNAQYEAGEIDEEEYERRQADLTAEMEGHYGAIEEEVLADAAADLEERGSALEEDATELEERQAALEERSEELEERGNALEEDAAELEERQASLEERGNALEERGETLEERGEELEERGQALEAEADALEEDREALEAEADELDEEFDELSEIDPTTEEQIEQLESMDRSEIDEVTESVLDEDGNGDGGAYAFLPTDHEPGSTDAEARTMFVTQTTEQAQSGMEGEAPDALVDSQLAMQSTLDERYGESAFVFGSGVIADESDRSMTDSLTLVLPLALLFVTIVLTLAYRDLLDILVGLFGILLVLVWTFGFMGWAGIAFNQIMIAVPVLLVGLSIDYAIHLFMRHREQRSELDEDAGGSTRIAMEHVIGGLGVAFVLVTATAVIGFLSNLVSPIGPIREFGIVSAVGISAALLIFGVLVPAIKVELDALLEGYGFDRRKRAFGTGGGLTSGFLAGGQRAARRVPWTVVIAALLVTAGGAYGATQVETTFEEEDLIADDPPAWMQELPEPLAVGEYSAKTHLDYVNDNFLRQDNQAQVLIEGDVTRDDTLERVDEAEERAAERETTIVLSSGDADVRSPLSVMESVAAEDEEFDETFSEADTDGDGVPDENLEAVYDALYEADEERAAEVVHRTEAGEYEALLLTVSVRGGAGTDAVTEDARSVATVVDGDGLEATATGGEIVGGIVETELFETVVESLVVTLVVVFAFLMAVYRRLYGSALLGAVTLFPIVLTVAWILGTMYLLGIPFNVITGMITSLTIGLGVAYNIHMTERFVLEGRRGRGIWQGLYRSVTGTGGALLGSAATTVGGFGLLAFAIVPPLRQFGLITGLTIVYAFLGSVFVLPSLLVLWNRYLRPPGGATDDSSADATDAGAIYTNASAETTVAGETRTVDTARSPEGDD
ncbi:MMPL family transporter [Halalkalicoccus ordinarius]|uniref:MMPL family transporter n=1 Tax=Halalkalicoccus ordinarius TaxID=3116651 RepID=UPI00300EC98A